MRLARTLALTALAALAALAFTATASAQTPLEATDVVQDVHCGNVTPVMEDGETVGATGGCEVDAHSTSPVELSGHQFGIEQHVALCDNEFTARLDEDAEGYLINQSLTEPQPPADPITCTREPCEHADGQKQAWPGHGFETTAGEFLHIEFCVDTLAMNDEINCEFNVPFTEINDDPHRYEFTANDLNGTTGGIFTPRCELTGHWTTETDMDNVEITH